MSQQPRRFPGPEFWTAFFTGVLAASTLVALIVAYQQLKECSVLEMRPCTSLVPREEVSSETWRRESDFEPMNTAEEERETRMKLLTGPAGIRHFVAKEIARKKCPQAFTIPELASLVRASESEVEEALRIMRSREHAKETSPGHWFIRT